MAERSVVVAKPGTSPILDAPIVLKEDIERGLTTIMPGLDRFAISPVESKSKKSEASNETTAFSVPELKKRFIADLQATFEQALLRGLADQTLPTEVAWVLVKGKPLLS